jgi:cytoskeleton-associated protein 5
MQPAPKQNSELKDDDKVFTTRHQDPGELLNQPINESNDCKEAIDLVITRISHQKIDITVQNLVQIDVVIKDRHKKDRLIPHIDNLLDTCAVKLNVANNVYLNSQDCQVDEIFKLFKSLFSVLIDIFESELGKHANTKTLKVVFYNLLCVMTDAKILNYPDGDQLIKAINIVTLKLLELSDQTTSYCALLKLLSECCNDENSSSRKYLEILMKCIWRQIKRLSSSNTNPAAQQAFENRVQQIDTSKVFSEIHAFLELYPSSSWQSKSSDLPLRTVKTLLFYLAKAKPSQVLDDLNKIRVPDDSEIKIYIMKMPKNGFQLSGKAFGGPAKTIIKGTSSYVAARELGDQLCPIFEKVEKVSSTETSKEDLAELYEFKTSLKQEKNPDIEPNKNAHKDANGNYVFESAN